MFMLVSNILTRKNKRKNVSWENILFYLYYINIYIHVGFKHFDKEKKEIDLLWEENIF